jgi:hypothetical protein
MAWKTSIPCNAQGCFLRLNKTTSQNGRLCLFKLKLQSENAEDGVGQGEPGYDTTHWKEQRKTSQQEEQPHTPAGNCLRERDIHFTLSLNVKNELAELPVCRIEHYCSERVTKAGW